jgi:tetratricopeptide (TPR) repeat protein
MVPRWRSLHLTVRSKELSVPRGKSGNSEIKQFSTEFKRRLEKWRLAPEVISAAELVETAIVEAEENEAIGAARSLLAPNSHAVPLVQKQAALLLRRVGKGSEVPDHINPEPQVTAGLWRRRIRLHPHNAVAWVELALNQTIGGHLKHAERSMTVALQLAPDNRHVLRSAARLFLHLGDPEHAHNILLRSTATKNDPWLIASEIALSKLAGKSPYFYKRGLVIVESDQLLPRQITELAGSIASNELAEGNRKKARRFFGASMTDPNGNALAQAEWASPLFGIDLFPLSRLTSVEEASEALAFHLYREGKFSDIPPACEAWAENEPYSIRPYEVGASSASTIEEYEKADELARHGLRIRPSAPTLLNSRAFSLACMGRIDEAERILKSMVHDVDERARLVSKANYGLIAFRRGQNEEGIALYRAAIDGFQRAQFPGLALFARAYLAREAALAHAPEATKIIADTKSAIENSNNPSVQRVFRTAEVLALAPEELQARLRSAPATR